MIRSAAPLIGIYWLYDSQVFGLSCSLAQAEPGVPGLLDSPFTHVDAWPHVRGEAGVPPHLEYDDLPRGRVLYASDAQAGIVYGDGKLIGGSRAAGLAEPIRRNRDAIMAFFGLAADKVVWRHDNHYTVGRKRIDPLLDD